MATTIVLTTDLYQGTATSSPIPWEAGKTDLAATGLLSNADALDATKTCNIVLELSYDGGLSYVESAKASWQGGNVIPEGRPNAGQPILPGVGASFSAGGQIPTHARVRLELPQVVSIGASITMQ